MAEINWICPFGSFYIGIDALARVVEAIVGEMTTTLRWISRCRAGDDGDHDDALEMEIKSTR